MSTIIFLAFVLILLITLAYIETHIDQIRSELMVRELIRKSISDARNPHRNPVRYASAGYSPRR